MKKIPLTLMATLVAVEGMNLCGVVSNVLQTRDNPSDIIMNSSGDTSFIEDTNNSFLNTSFVYSDPYSHGLVCDLNGNGVKDSNEEMAKATGKYGGSLDINYSFNVELSNVSDSPSNSSENVEIKQPNQMLLKRNYNEIQQDWNHYDFNWYPTSVGSIVAVNNFENILHSVNISNIYNRIVKIGKFQTLGYSQSTLNFQERPAEIDISTLEVKGSNYFTLNGFEARDIIKINQLNLKSSSQTDITIKAPKVIIDNLNSENDDNRIEIYADEIYIDKIKFAQRSKLIIHPYTPGQKVKFYSTQIDHSSSSSMILDSGDYYVGQMNFHSDASTTPITASGVNEVVNIYINHDTDIPSGNFINSISEGNFGANPPKNFRMFINGDLQVESAGSTLNGIFYVEEKTQIKTDDYFKGAISSGGEIKIGNNNKFYWDSSMNQLLSSCVSHIKNFINTNFDAFDWYNGWNYFTANKIIDTKIVNRDFLLLVLAKNSSGYPISPDMVKHIKFAILNMKNNQLMSSWRDYPGKFDPNPVTTINDLYQNYNFKIDRATKEARVVFKICRGEAGQVFNYEVCDHECNLDSTRPCWDYGLSSDNFAIIPKEFKLIGSADKDGVYITFEALDDEGNPVRDYNESVGDTFDVNYSEVKNGCLTGKFDHNSKDINESWDFRNGISNLDLNYSETGNVKIEIKDKSNCSDRFNAVDCKDNPNIKIESDSQNIFIPINHLRGKFAVYNFRKYPFTYLSNNVDEINAKIEMNVSARNYKDEVIQNYVKSCYAKDVNATFKHNILDDYFKDINTTEGVFESDKNLTMNIAKNEFVSPIVSKSLYFNLNREVNESVEPQNFNITDAFITNEDNVTSLNSFSPNGATFYYGYFDYQKDASAYSTNLNTKVFYKYYKDGRFVLAEGHNADMGNINTIFVDKVNYTISNIDSYGRQIIRYFYNKSTPYSTMAQIDIPDYLWYSPANNKYISPSNSDSCENHPCQKLTFYSSSQGWGGLNSNNAPAKYNETNGTTKMKAFRELNTTKHLMPSIIW